MKTIFYSISIALLATSCNSAIKDTKTEVLVEEGTQIMDDETPSLDEMLGFWVGDFEADVPLTQEKLGIHANEGFWWNRANKIGISIDEIENDQVVGHSIVAGNNRPFLGSVNKGEFHVKEPGDHMHDGEFKFQILLGKLIGEWTAYENIDIKKRKYTLEKKTFAYSPGQMLEKGKRFVDWNTVNDDGKYDAELEEMVATFKSATAKIYSINASSKLLSKKDVENLKKGDLLIIRNTIYARHGYSFKYRPLRIFFDAQEWYMPVHTDIKSDFTEIEKKNIQLMLRYEKNAVEYYDYFGRG